MELCFNRLMNGLLSDMAGFVFGPVPSRRLGRSLGVDITPPKTCTFDCIYCQVGRTTKKDIVRMSYFDPDSIVKEIMEKVSAGTAIDYISFSGSGEPTLNKDIGYIIRRVKEHTSIPVAVITNGSLLFDPDIRADISAADVVLPSLDAATEETFHYIDRPHSSITLSDTIEGLMHFRQEYQGQIWLEIMLIKGINDEPDELQKLKSIIESIRPDKIHLNTVTRPPADYIADRMEEAELDEICRFFGLRCEVISKFHTSSPAGTDVNWTEHILETLERRALTLEDIVDMTGLDPAEVEQSMEHFVEIGKIGTYSSRKKMFYIIPGDTGIR